MAMPMPEHATWDAEGASAEYPVSSREDAMVGPIDSLTRRRGQALLTPFLEYGIEAPAIVARDTEMIVCAAVDLVLPLTTKLRRRNYATAVLWAAGVSECAVSLRDCCCRIDAALSVAGHNLVDWDPLEVGWRLLYQPALILASLDNRKGGLKRIKGLSPSDCEPNQSAKNAKVTREALYSLARSRLVAAYQNLPIEKIVNDVCRKPPKVPSGGPVVRRYQPLVESVEFPASHFAPRP